MEENKKEFESVKILELSQELSEKTQYLSSTDFYYARLAETGEEVPADVVAKRREAREFIRENKLQ